MRPADRDGLTEAASVPALDLAGVSRLGAVVGVQKYVYDIFGPGVNVAARLEALAGPMEILPSGDALRGIGSGFRTESLRPRDLRGIGEVEVHRLLASDEPEAMEDGAWRAPG